MPTEPTPPPMPQQPAPPRSSDQDGLDAYNTVADTVGFVPNIRGVDNLIQIAAAVVGTVAGLITGWVTAPWGTSPIALPLAVGAVGGLVAGVFLSGLALMILGWVRAIWKAAG